MQQGLQARREGRSAAARAAFERVLQAQPGQPDALTLLAELLAAEGQQQAAHDLLLRAVRADPQHVVAWARLAATLETLQQLPDAEAAWARAAALKPDFIEALYNRARLAHALGRPGEARAALEQALQHPAVPLPLLGQMLQLQALLQEEAGSLAEALQTLDRALVAAPQRAALHHNRGVLLHRLQQPARALAALDTALALGLHAPDAHYNRGNSLQSLGRSSEALQAYRTALALDPQHALALWDAARLRWRMGEADFCADLDAAIAAAATPAAAAVALGIKGRLLLRAEQFAAAAQAFADAAARAPEVPGFQDGLGQALARLGQLDHALAAHQRAVDLAPGQAAGHITLATCLLQAGQHARAVRVAEEAVRLNPQDQQAWAVAGLAWRATGNPRDAWLNDVHRHVLAFDLPAPEGWADMASFNAALAEALQALHTDAQAPVDQTLRHGSQTLGDIFEQQQPLVVLLKARIAEAVDAYIARLAAMPADPGHPLLGRLARRWRFTDSWSSRLRSSGFHTHHVHPHGWISSCYYVALPPVVGRPGAGQAGWITFGTPDVTVAGWDHPPRLAVQPRAGRLVLFPSFLWHGTVPFEDAATRLTVAFDVVPVP
jgi:tetratricopeptide (TPR) repeat protein